MATLAGMAIAGVKGGNLWAEEGIRREDGKGTKDVDQPFEFIELSKPLAGIVASSHWHMLSQVPAPATLSQVSTDIGHGQGLNLVLRVGHISAIRRPGSSHSRPVGPRLE
ncbi:GM23112 [Drosophila sechellia]|uniref:GM23112 n=1 Tax=Drosophila sechellia TaxID=7238 RepID=B4IIC5_DROSE|nr:GM23112 [Drosophila sechellia]